ncbi:MAG: acyl-CoA dehydratase activase [Deltaproteobacteria bacterium]|jgi:predicted CoA-substrate-specific enzyme activase|nr:acyl-CoA dehydratase activase [Deltaproteobacteria bacterium]
MSVPYSPGQKYFLGLDAGSISLKATLLDAKGALAFQEYVRHQGRPYAAALSTLEKLALRFPPSEIAPPFVTGVAAAHLAELLGGEAIGEILALTLAAQKLCPKAKSLIDIGGEDTKVLWLEPGEDGLALADFAMNTLCAAGTGSFLDQQAHRLGYDVAEFGALALKSEVPPRVAGRCSVFAKSDMIHLQQSATPDYEIVYGLCLAMARSLKSGLAKGRDLPAPVVFVGGVAANPGLARAFREVLSLGPNDLVVPKTHFVFAALGAAFQALARHGAQADRSAAANPPAHPDPATAANPASSDARLGPAGHAAPALGLNLDRLRAFALGRRPSPDRLPPLKRPAQTPKVGTVDWSAASFKRPWPVYVGVDVGSVSTNVALVDPHGRLVARQYLPTAGRPLEALAQAMANILLEAGDKVEVLGACSTGSGRYLSADYLGADLTVNEITAQAAAAVSLDPEVDTIFEIGGQDSKYISLSQGVIVDFTMNKACAAGTGSFLEEQADKLGLNIKEEFGELALASEGPVALGERCTVFMESDLVHCQQNGVGLKDLAAGLCYGIVANYLGRVVETRAVGKKIFFQGGTSFNQGVAAAFAARLGRPVVVPDNADVTGAVGAALVARDRRSWAKSSFVGFDLSNRSYEIKSFECRHCANRCEIRQVEVAGGRPFFYGSRCDRYEAGGRAKVVPKFPDLFQFRAEAAFNCPELQDLLTDLQTGLRPRHGRIGLIRTMGFAELGPFWSVFWATLGYEPVWSAPTNKTSIHLGCERTEGEFCFPIKAAHGHLLDLMGQGVERIFLPSVVNLPPDVEGARDNAACPYAQSLPFTAAAALGLAAPALLTGPVFFGEGPKALLDGLAKIAAPLGLSGKAVALAVDEGWRAQRNFSLRLWKKGAEALRHLGQDDVAMVVVARPYNGFDPGMNLRLSRKLSDLGVLGLPLDFLPLSNDHPEAKSHYWRYGQKITAAALAIAADPRLEALYISNFGCGPDSFILHFFKRLMGPKPFLEIEIDEHSSDVGAVTRLEAFLDSLAARKAKSGRPKAFPPAKPLATKSRPQAGQTVYVPPMCDHAGVLAAVLRGAGLAAEVLPESDQETVLLGRSQTSGKECYPLILTVGDFLKVAQRKDFEPQRSAFFMPSSNGPCRFGQYSRYLSLIAQRLGFPEVEIIALDQTGGMYGALSEASPKGQSLAKGIWLALAGTDLLQKALFHARPREKSPGLAELAYKESLADFTECACQSLSQAKKAMTRARDRFEATRAKANGVAPRPVVGLVGEIYVRSNRFANEDVVKRLEGLGAEVVAPPFTEWVLYTGFVNSMRAARQGQWKKRLAAALTSLAQAHDQRALAKPWAGFFPGGAKDPPIREIVSLGENFLPRAFQGEAILSLGKGLEFYRQGARGLVNIMPFTCMPGMIVGGLTNRLRAMARGLPALSLAYDGQSQSNAQARLEAFMGQVHNFRAPAKKGRSTPITRRDGG